MRYRTALTASLAVVLVAGAALLAAPSASADQVWYQGVGRASADASCPTSPSDDLEAGWSQWSPSWAQWADGGKGGYVCTRAITWAYEDTGGRGNCVLVNTDLVPGGPYYVNFGSRWSVAKGSTVNAYHDAACADWALTYSGDDVPYDVVLAPEGEDQAQERCAAAFDPDLVAWHLPGGYVGPAIWFCLTQDEFDALEEDQP